MQQVGDGRVRRELLVAGRPIGEVAVAQEYLARRGVKAALPGFDARQPAQFFVAAEGCHDALHQGRRRPVFRARLARGSGIGRRVVCRDRRFLGWRFGSVWRSGVAGGRSFVLRVLIAATCTFDFVHARHDPQRIEQTRGNFRQRIAVVWAAQKRRHAGRLRLAPPAAFFLAGLRGRPPTFVAELGSPAVD